MSIRSFDELKEAFKNARAANDAGALVQCAIALELVATAEANALAARARGRADHLHGNSPTSLEHYHRALAIYEALGDRGGFAHVSVSIGNVHADVGNSAASLEYHHRALEIYEELGDRSDIANVASNIGSTYADIGAYPTALEHYHRALTLHQELGDRSAVAGVIGNIGIVHYNTGNFSTALEHYHRAMALFEEVDDRRWMGTITANIGLVHSRVGNSPAALAHFHRAIGLHEERGDRRGVARVTANVGGVHKDTGNYPAALEYFHRALVMHEELGERSGVARVTGNIGNVHNDTGNYPAALEHYQRALELHQELGDRSAVATVTDNIGIVHRRTGNIAAALDHFYNALALHTSLGERGGMARVTVNIAGALMTSGSHAEAEALLLTLEGWPIDEPSIILGREQCRARSQEHHGDLDGATSTLDAALEIAVAHALAPEQVEIHKQLRELALKRNDLAGYVEHNNEFMRITEEINGKDTATKLAMQEKQREIDAREREHQKHMAVLHSTLPKSIADRVARGETVHDHHENASVLFLDLVGFTDLSSSRTSEEVIALLDDVFTQCDEICEKYDVTKIKTIGDSYMCVSFDSVTNAALCAIEMVKIESRIKDQESNHIALQYRIGIHCGPVTAGVIGKERMQYDVWGDTVNVASRMESSGEPGRVHVSESFALALNLAVPPVTRYSSLVTINRGSIDVKGKGMMTTYWLEGA